MPTERRANWLKATSEALIVFQCTRSLVRGEVKPKPGVKPSVSPTFEPILRQGARNQSLNVMNRTALCHDEGFGAHERYQWQIDPEDDKWLLLRLLY